MSPAVTDNPTLTRRLKRALLATMLAVLVLATIAAAVTSYLQASDIQDDTLLSVAQLVETNQMDSLTDDDIFDDDDLKDSTVRIWQMGRKNKRGPDVNHKLKTGFHTLHEGDNYWRVFVTKENRSGKQFIVAQNLGVSTELAMNSAINMAIPLLLLFLLVPLLVTFIVRHSFKPLNALTRKVSSSDSLQLDATNRNDIPVEVLPFVSAIDSLLKKNEAYNQRQRRFIADAAHELRTPITALSLEIENVQSAKTEHSRQERQSALAKSVVRLQRLVNQLLDLARAQSGLSTNSTTINLNNLVKDQIGELYPLADSKDIDIQVPRNESVHLADDNNQVQHLIRNALSNAIKFAPQNGSINIEIYQDKGDAVFNVTDNGPGVTEDQLEKLDQPFYRPDGQASGEGAGLGLAICNEIAAQLNGKLTFSNISPTGFSFNYRQKLVAP